MPTDVKKSHSRVFSQFLHSFRLYFQNILVLLAFRPNGSAVNKTIDHLSTEIPLGFCVNL